MGKRLRHRLASLPEHGSGRTGDPGDGDAGAQRHERPQWVAQAGVARGETDVFQPDVACAGGEGGQHRLVGEDVDATRQTFGAMRQCADCRAGEEFATAIACAGEPVLDVGGDLGPVQRREFEVVGDAVENRAGRAFGESLVEFGLSEQDDLQQLVLGRFEVRQQAHLLERIGRHRVRFVDQSDGAPALAPQRDQAVRDGVEQRSCVADFGAELEGDRAQQVFGIERRVRQPDRDGRRGQAVEQHAQQHRLAGADLAGDLDDAFVVVQRVFERGERVAALSAGKEVAGRRRDPEGRFVQAEMLEVHVSRASLRLRRRPRGCRVPRGGHRASSD